jgi:hypothetical protein
MDKMLANLIGMGAKIVSLEGIEFDKLEIAIVEDGEKVCVELHRGGVDSEEGGHSGGGWGKPVIGFFHYFDLASNAHFIPQGCIKDMNGKTIQCASAEIGAIEFPYRNLQPYSNSST